MTQDELKAAAAQAALAYVVPGAVLGVGSGSTVDLFVDLLGQSPGLVSGAVASSERTAGRLRRHGIPLVDLNDVDTLSICVDGADEIDAGLAMIKGGGGALTREKIVAAVARRFVCIADEAKMVRVLGRFPLPVEVIPMARAYVARVLAGLGGTPRLREGFVTDNGNVILDVTGLDLDDPAALEERLNNVTGVVANGLFARRGADVLLLGTQAGVRTLERA